MTFGGRYVKNADPFKSDAFAVLRTKFRDRRAFESFYEAIPDARRKNEFLRVCCSYRYLAKHGKWQVYVRGVNKDISYLDNSVKLVAVFSLIESLSDEKHQDFYDWLSTQSAAAAFPIKTKAELDARYSVYKSTYGYIRRCVTFFDRLGPEQKAALCRSISIEGKPTENIKKLAQHLYRLRSNFVHPGEFAHELSSGYIFTDKGVVRSTLTVEAVFDAFENGLLAYFSH